MTGTAFQKKLMNKKETNMNKKERFCDVDNIVAWRHIFTALLALS